MIGISSLRPERKVGKGKESIQREDEKEDERKKREEERKRKKGYRPVKRRRL